MLSSPSYRELYSLWKVRLGSAYFPVNAHYNMVHDFHNLKYVIIFIFSYPIYIWSQSQFITSVKHLIGVMIEKCVSVPANFLKLMLLSVWSSVSVLQMTKWRLGLTFLSVRPLIETLLQSRMVTFWCSIWHKSHCLWLFVLSSPCTCFCMIWSCLYNSTWIQLEPHGTCVKKSYI